MVHDFFRYNTYGSAETVPRPVTYSDTIAEQAMDKGLYAFRSRQYPDHSVKLSLVGLITVNFQARYFGLCNIMYVYPCCSSIQILIVDQFTRIESLCACKIVDSKSVELMQREQVGSSFLPGPAKVILHTTDEDTFML